MTVSLLHAFASAKSDGLDITQVQPSNWNAEHVLSMATSRLLGRTTALAGAAEEISVGARLSLTAGSLNLADSVSLVALTVSGALTGATLDISSDGAVGGNFVVGGTLGVTGATTLAAALAGTTFTFSGDGIMTGTGALEIPLGTTAQRPTGALGQLRYNSSLGRFEKYAAGNSGDEWAPFAGPFATNAEALAGTDTIKPMTSVRVREAIDARLNIPALVPSYTAHAWVNFNGTGTVAIRNSGNVTSITDNGAGDYTVNFTVAMPHADYAASVIAGGTGTGANNSVQVISMTTSAFRFKLVDDTGTAEDASIVLVTITC